MKYTATVNGKTYEVEVERADSPHKPIPRGVYTGEMPAPAPAAPVAAAPAAAAPAPAPAAAPAAGGTEVRSPMPGNILNILVSEGQAVTAGQVLVMLEAMKMENEIVAPAAGTVKQIPVAKGAAVDTDALLVVLG